jgi:hypothetical protein
MKEGMINILDPDQIQQLHDTMIWRHGKAGQGSWGDEQQ